MTGIRQLIRLKPRVKLLTDFYVWDVETGDRKDDVIRWKLNARPESFIFGVIYGLNYTKVIHSLPELIETFKESRFKNRKVFAHNATYDLTTAFGNIYDMDPGAIFNGSRFISATNGNCIFADSMNIFVGQSVEKLGRQLGMEKLGMAGKAYDKSDWTNASEKAYDINGCIRDCEIVWEGLYRTFEFAGDIKITQASLSMTYFRRYHQPYTIRHNELTSHFWDSYYGGRCEAFKIGKTQSKVIDVNSMYPDRMKHEVFPNPVGLKSSRNVKTKFFVNRLLPNYEGCIYATIYHLHTHIGLLPYKEPSTGRLLFPVGKFSGCWNFNEFRFAYDTGNIKILSIDKIIYSERMASPFAGYVDELFLLKYKAELEGNEFERDRTKRFANSLYGKFAQRIDEESIYIKDMDAQFKLILEHQKRGTFKKLIIFNAERNDCFLVVGSNKNISVNHSIPSFASYITSGARVVLLKKLLELEHNRPTYCDTDSIFIENDLGIISESHLGGWKLEDKIVTEISGLKNYKFLSGSQLKRRLKGVPEKAIEVIPGTWEFENLLKTKEAIRRNLDAGVLTKRTKTISGKYDKRIVLSNGETQPIKL